jgi:hypothetical protein
MEGDKSRIRNAHHFFVPPSRSGRGHSELFASLYFVTFDRVAVCSLVSPHQP